MNFGTGGFHAAYGKTEDEVRPIFRRYLDEGGNFVDTADFYTAGESETILGKLITEAGVRDRVVLTTKFTNSVDPADPNAGGNGRKHMIRALEASLRRLGTDYVDLFLLHTWDRLTPVEEVVRTFDDLVRAGKIRYAGLSDVPAWYAAKAQTYAEAHSLTPMINLQLPYSLVQREIETEHVPMGQHLGLGVTAWSPLAGGFLTGKYRDGGSGRFSDGRHVVRARMAAAQAPGGGGGQARRVDGPGGDQLGRNPAGHRVGDRRGEQRRPARQEHGRAGLRDPGGAAGAARRGERGAAGFGVPDVHSGVPELDPVLDEASAVPPVRCTGCLLRVPD